MVERLEPKIDIISSLITAQPVYVNTYNVGGIIRLRVAWDVLSVNVRNDRAQLVVDDQICEKENLEKVLPLVKRIQWSSVLRPRPSAGSELCYADFCRFRLKLFHLQRVLGLEDTESTDLPSADVFEKLTKKDQRKFSLAMVVQLEKDVKVLWEDTVRSFRESDDRPLVKMIASLITTPEGDHFCNVISFLS